MEKKPPTKTKDWQEWIEKNNLKVEFDENTECRIISTPDGEIIEKRTRFKEEGFTKNVRDYTFFVISGIRVTYKNDGNTIESIKDQTGRDVAPQDINWETGERINKAKSEKPAKTNPETETWKIKPDGTYEIPDGPTELWDNGSVTIVYPDGTLKKFDRDGKEIPGETQIAEKEPAPTPLPGEAQPAHKSVLDIKPTKSTTEEAPESGPLTPELKEKLQKIGDIFVTFIKDQRTRDKSVETLAAEIQDTFPSAGISIIFQSTGAQVEYFNKVRKTNDSSRRLIKIVIDSDMFLLPLFVSPVQWENTSGFEKKGKDTSPKGFTTCIPAMLRESGQGYEVLRKGVLSNEKRVEQKSAEKTSTPNESKIASLEDDHFYTYVQDDKGYISSGKVIKKELGERCVSIDSKFEESTKITELDDSCSYNYFAYSGVKKTGTGQEIKKLAKAGMTFRNTVFERIETGEMMAFAYEGFRLKKAEGEIEAGNDDEAKEKLDKERAIITRGTGFTIEILQNNNSGTILYKYKGYEREAVRGIIHAKNETEAIARLRTKKDIYHTTKCNPIEVKEGESLPKEEGPSVLITPPLPPKPKNPEGAVQGKMVTEIKLKNGVVIKSLDGKPFPENPPVGMVLIGNDGIEREVTRYESKDNPILRMRAKSFTLENMVVISMPDGSFIPIRGKKAGMEFYGDDGFIWVLANVTNDEEGAANYTQTTKRWREKSKINQTIPSTKKETVRAALPPKPAETAEVQKEGRYPASNGSGEIEVWEGGKLVWTEKIIDLGTTDQKGKEFTFESGYRKRVNNNNVTIWEYYPDLGKTEIWYNENNGQPMRRIVNGKEELSKKFRFKVEVRDKETGKKEIKEIEVRAFSLDAARSTASDEVEKDAKKKAFSINLLSEQGSQSRRWKYIAKDERGEETRGVIEFGSNEEEARKRLIDMGFTPVKIEEDIPDKTSAEKIAVLQNIIKNVQDEKTKIYDRNAEISLKLTKLGYTVEQIPTNDLYLLDGELKEAELELEKKLKKLLPWNWNLKKRIAKLKTDIDLEEQRVFNALKENVSKKLFLEERKRKAIRNIKNENWTVRKLLEYWRGLAISRYGDGDTDRERVLSHIKSFNESPLKLFSKLEKENPIYEGITDQIREIEAKYNTLLDKLAKKSK